MAFFNEDIDLIFTNLKTSEKGINKNEIVSRQTKFGTNVLDKQKRESFLKKLLLQFKNIMIIILLLSAAVSITMSILNHDYENLFEGFLILVIVIVNAIVGVLQEQKAENALAALQKQTEPFATVLREGKQQKIKVHELVVGDIIMLKTGDVVPADVRLISSQNLKTNESSLTGESLAISKNTETIHQKNLPLASQNNMCFSGTNIVSGKATGVVVAVGKNTEIGKIAKILSTSIKEKTPLEKEIDKIGKVLTIGILLIVFVVFFVQFFFNDKIDLLSALLTAVTLAVAAIPESLPAVITIIMALGVQRLARKNAIIKKLSAVETLGCCNVVCSDKTGTLTKNEMKVVHINLNLKTENLTIFNSSSQQKFTQITAICNNIVLDKNKFLGDATEVAIAEFLKQQGIDIFEYKKKFKKLSESEFDSSKKQMRVLCQNNNSQILFAKGAIDYLLGSCSKILLNGNEVALTKKLKAKIVNQNEQVCELGERVIAFAYKQNPFSLEDDNLVFAGFVGIIDPPRPEAFASIKKCKKAGLKTIMITGDHPATAFAIAKKLGIAKSKKEVITGKDLDNLSDKELSLNILNYKVFARVTPEHKLKIVNALKSRNNIVAMTGDGINDAPSIKAANIGLCMGKTGTDVTKEVADIIISDDNFKTIVLAIEEGRTIYQNISKTILFLLSTNLVEVLGIFVTSIIMHDSIFLLPTQILFINLITDSLPAFALGIEPTESNVMNNPPRNANKSLLSGKTGGLILYEGFIQSLAVLIMFVFATHRFGNSVASTMSFLTICLMQIVHAINCKTEGSIFKINIFKNKFFNFSFLLLLAIILTVYFVPAFANLFGLVLLSNAQWFFVIITSLSIIPLVEVGKFFIK